MGTLASSPRRMLRLGAYADRLMELHAALTFGGGPVPVHVTPTTSTKALPVTITEVPEVQPGRASEAATHAITTAAGSGSGITCTGSTNSGDGDGGSRSGGVFEASVDEIAFVGAKVITPTGHVLVRDLTLRIPVGQHVLVTGPNGAGKSRYDDHP